MASRNWGFNLKSNSSNYPDHGHHGDPPPTRKNSHGRAGNRTRDLVASSQKLWPPDHEAGQVGSEVHFRPADDMATDTEWQLPDVVLTQFVSPDDEYDVLETCREL